MRQGYPPQSNRSQEINFLLEIMSTVVENRTAIYLSTPITTGKRFSNWQTSSNAISNTHESTYLEEHRRNVMEPNRAHVRSLIRKQRNTLGRVVIDPTALDALSGWTQDDYRVFWGRVIERYVSTVIFADDWQYSNGCAYEFLVAYRTGARAVDERQSLLTLEEGLQLIISAIIEMKSHDVPTEFLEYVREELLQGKDKKWHAE